MSYIQNINKSYLEFDLFVESLEIPDSGITLICGDSGSGKSSFLRVLMGLESCPGMSWIFKGDNLGDKRPQDRMLGVVFQSLELFPHMTALENIYFHAKARGISKDDFFDFMDDFFVISKMKEHLHKKVGVLSGGEQQRVALLRAIAGKPRILLLDEPFSSLDIKLKKDLKNLLLKIIEIQKIPCILVSHDIEDRNFAKKIVEFSRGKII